MKPITHTALARICNKLYGPNWQARLAEELGRSPGTISKWANDVNPVPRVAADRIRKLAAQAGGSDAS